MINYIIVTPTKNEEKNILNLLRCMERQTIKPSLWVIADESNDNTPTIVEEAISECKWIKGMFLDRSEGYLGISYAAACKAGFDFATEYCKRNKINYNYIGLVDADVTIDEGHFEELISKFEKYPELGIASGIEYWNVSDKLVKNPQRDYLPIGPVRLWRKECFEETGGYIVSEAPPDTVSNIKAKLNGWKTKQFNNARVVTRRTSTATGYWKGFTQRGKYAYAIHTPVVVVLTKAMKYSFEKPFYIGLAFIVGYICSSIGGVKRIEDNEIRAYMKHERPKELFKYYKGKLLGGGSK